MFIYMYIPTEVECKYPAVEGCRMFSDLALTCNACICVMTASTEASTSHTLVFFNPMWLSGAIFSSGVPATKSVLFVYFRSYLTFSSSSEFLFILSEVSHLQDCPSSSSSLLFTERAHPSLDYPVLSPLLAEE